VEFHVHTYASLLAIKTMLSQNLTRKTDQLVMYASRLLNRAKQNYNTIKKEALVMVFSLHKFRHYLLGNKFVFYVNHMALVYLVNKSYVSRIITRWLLLFLKYNFIVMYKLGITNVVAIALSRPRITKPINVPNQTIDVSLFYTKLEWLNNVKDFLRTWQIETTLLVQQKYKW